MLPKAFNQRIKRNSAPRATAQVLVHRDPGFQRQGDLFRKDPHDLVVAVSDGGLANADTCARSDQRELRQIVIGSHRKGFPPPGAERLAGVPDERRRFVKSDERMIGEIGNVFRRTVPCEIVPVRMESQHNLAHALGDQQFLPRAHHANGNIRLSLHQILDAIRESELHHEIGMLITQARNDDRKDFNANHVTCRDPDAAAHSAALARSSALERRNSALQ